MYANHKESEAPERSTGRSPVAIFVLKENWSLASVASYDSGWSGCRPGLGVVGELLTVLATDRPIEIGR